MPPKVKAVMVDGRVYVDAEQFLDGLEANGIDASEARASVRSASDQARP